MIAIQGQCCNHTKTRSTLSQKISRSKKGSAVRINGNKQKGKKAMEEKRPKRKKKLEVAPPGFEPTSQLPVGQYASPHTTGPCEHYLV